ncbi:hypothetical protein ARMGADRAFT_1038400 [Armillaria gallica]|uniref:Uncharacterized protein n=1 Tax=Armillaria gallica TaxID=47427 RepID=A0A2H3CI33_ARMGA|nr:hypothetical protein ARMGADRAFT_1038400 [Armillaria gallica]
MTKGGGTVTKFFKQKLAYIMEEEYIDMDMEENKGLCKKQMTCDLDTSDAPNKNNDQLKRLVQQGRKEIIMNEGSEGSMKLKQHVGPEVRKGMKPCDKMMDDGQKFPWRVQDLELMQCPGQQDGVFEGPHYTGWGV